LTAILKNHTYKLVAIVALVGILLQTFGQVVIVGIYYANKDYIARYLCENKNKPELRCEGKCCLKKKLAKQGKEQGSGEQSRKNSKFTYLFFANEVIGIDPVFSSGSKSLHPHYIASRTSSYSARIFHPPLEMQIG
jgi:hypothetical protein